VGTGRPSGSLRCLYPDDGWFCTADAGQIDQEGRLTVTGRVGDMIVTGGEKVWPEPVERAIHSAIGVRDVAVCGVPDPAWGHAVVAVIAADPEKTPDLASLRHWVKQLLPAYCAPKHVVVVDAIPRTALGKVRRRDVQAIAIEALR
jgi:o-succinylbenzoate---CoA ligase